MSEFYRTQPVGYTEQDWFVNAAALVETEMRPQDLLIRLLGIEEKMGRIRTIKWGPRLIDLDLLFYDNVVIREEDFSIPHPFLDQRRFVLVPLADVAPDWAHPLTGLTTVEMLDSLDETDQEVRPL